MEETPLPPQEPTTPLAQGAPLQRWHITPIQKKIALYGGIVIVLLLCALGGVQYLRYQAYANVAKEAAKMQQDITALQAKRKAQDPMARWKTYTNTEYGFEFKYPADLLEKQDKNLLFNIQNTSLKLELGGAISAESGVEGRDYAGEGYQIYADIVSKKETDAFNLENSTEQIPTKLNFTAMNATRYDTADAITRGPVVLIIDPKHTTKYIEIGYMAICETKCKNSDLEILFGQILSTFKFTASVDGKFCGGIAGFPCPEGYTCKLDGSYPDAGGVCVQTR
jgi:hypothetical protein